MWWIIFIAIFGLLYIKNNYNKGHYHLRDDEVDTLYYTLSCINNSGLNYFTICGTLIGVIRHGGLIPWDDDADIAILDSEEIVLKNIDWSKYDLELVPSWIGYKLMKKGTTFPFIDIFIMKWDNKRGYYHYKGEDIRKKWPDEWITKDQLYPLIKKPFGKIWLWCPNKSLDYLERAYGNDVMTHYYEEYSHRIEKSKIKHKRRLPYPVPVCV